MLLIMEMAIYAPSLLISGPSSVPKLNVVHTGLLKFIENWPLNWHWEHIQIQRQQSLTNS